MRNTESQLLFNHSTRVYYFGALAGKARGLKFDPELLYVGRRAQAHRVSGPQRPSAAAQALLPMMELIEHSRMVIDELIGLMGRASIEASMTA